MARSRSIHVALLAAHAAIAAVLVGGLAGTLMARQAELAEVRRLAEEERRSTDALRQQVQVQEALLDGMRATDPYVVELLARERLGWNGGPAEVRPPPLPDEASQ